MLKPEQIKQVREYWGLSQNSMSLVLGFGINVWRDYEGGAVPSKSNGYLVLFCNDPYSFRDLLLMVPGESKLKIGKPYHAALKKAEDAIASINQEVNAYKMSISRNYITDQTES